MDFWNKFLKIEQMVVHHLRKNTVDDQEQALNGIDIAGKISGFPLLFQVGFNLRNGKTLDERKDSLELVISPNWDRKKVSLVNQVYEASKKADLPTYWNVVKYQVFEPSFVYELNVQGVTYEDFEYCAQLNFEGTKAWVGVLIFVKDELAKKILKKKKSDEKSPENNEWELDGNSVQGKAPLLFLNSAVGEYNMITRIKAVEFLPANSHQTIPRYSLADLHQEFEKIDRQDYEIDAIHSCVRCGYHSYQVDVAPCGKCKKVYYCDEMCKKADAKNHKFVCK